VQAVIGTIPLVMLFATLVGRLFRPKNIGRLSARVLACQFVLDVGLVKPKAINFVLFAGRTWLGR
jgi:hypothetical protein